MKNHYHYLAICLCAVLTGIYLISCDKDDDDDNPLVGTWIEDIAGQSDLNHIAFFQDGIGFSYEVDDSSQSPVNVKEFNYQCVGVNLIFIDGVQNKDTTSYEFKGDKLCITYGSLADSIITRSYNRDSEPISRDVLSQSSINAVD